MGVALPAVRPERVVVDVRDEVGEGVVRAEKVPPPPPPEEEVGVDEGRVVGVGGTEGVGEGERNEEAVIEPTAVGVGRVVGKGVLEPLPPTPEGDEEGEGERDGVPREEDEAEVEGVIDKSGEDVRVGSGDGE